MEVASGKDKVQQTLGLNVSALWPPCLAASCERQTVKELHTED
jgi:hypothetical protein